MSTDVIEQLWQQIAGRVFITRAQFVAELDGWTIEAVESDGELAFAVLTRGPELHFATFLGLPITRAMIRARIEPLIERYGYAQVRTPKTDLRQRRFNEALGFVVAGETEFFIHYRITSWRRPCP